MFEALTTYSFLQNAMFEALTTYSFLQNALYASLFASIACGIVGTLVLFNRLTFLAGGAAHAAYGGIGLSMYFSLPPLLCTLGFTVTASLIMAFCILRNNANSPSGRFVTPDTAIGILWAMGMAFGIILIELTPGYLGELMGFLFGSILTVPKTDLWLMGFFDVLLLGVFLFFHQGLWAMSLDIDFAKAKNIPVHFLFLLLVGMTAISIVMLIRIVGLVLVIALLTIPPALAQRMTTSFYTTILLATLLSFFFCVAGIFLSWFTNISSGATTVMLGGICYLLFMCVELCITRSRAFLAK